MERNYFPTGETLSKDEVKRQFDLIKETPFDNEKLAYKILMPKGWVGETILAPSKDLNTEKLKPLGIYKGPDKGGANPFVQIQAIQLTREITAANWLRHYAMVTDRKMIAIKPLSVHFADCVMEYTIDGAKFIGRATALINSNRLFFLLTLALADLYEEYEETFGVCIVSFGLQNLSRDQSIEKHLPYELKGIVRFRYPESWKYREITETPEGKEAVDLFNFDPDNNICGKIRVKSVEKRVSTGVDSQIEDTLEEYREANITPGELVEVVNVEIGAERFESAIVNVYKGEIEGNDILQEMWIAVIEDPQYYFVVTLLTPFREQLFFYWAINRRAFDIILENLA